jgi:hypothetical protein
MKTLNKSVLNYVVIHVSVLAIRAYALHDLHDVINESGLFYLTALVLG